MDWLSRLFTTDVLSLLIPIVAIIGVFAIAGLKAHHRHQERIEKIKQGLSPND